jgi:hypothetical protein
MHLMKSLSFDFKLRVLLLLGRYRRELNSKPGSRSKAPNFKLTCGDQLKRKKFFAVLLISSMQNFAIVILVPALQLPSVLSLTL